ncbi:four-carbon acid sugar kinase family protein [Mixta tenebrionis]|uniref:Four-carbon acid sugar kinase family protein n=1 Tax=Mixta tenebrionis TaxID=2562439 RepID=A0A506VF16_9GAMM|nr:four-carbon acid sugar kinase family protein [Mixta tenebrionis]TPW43929.1 four-carbon acid sugar kinase family protein [Mixta tenebrionis]
MKLLVIADDFTGANDTGVQLAKKGAHTEVVFSLRQKPSPRADVLVVNTESRASDAEAAAQAVTAALTNWLRPELLIYKKIDSTFRGNVGAEIEAALLASGKSLALVAAAIPGAGRTTLNGECLVNGTPLAQTEFASDPRTPIVASRIKTILMQQSALPVREITLAALRNGELPALLHRCQQQTPAIAVVDALTEQDLARIAAAALALPETPLLVGAAGLAGALPPDAYRPAQQTLPVLVVAGSMSEATRRQVELALHSQRAQAVELEVTQLLQADERAVQALARRVCAVLAEGQHCILRTSRSAADRHQIDALSQQFQCSRAALGERLSQRLGELTLAIIGQARIGGLFLTGGDIAIAVAQALGAEGYRIQQEVAPCIPCGRFINSELDDLPVITKAGGFGSESTLCDALSFIEEMYCDH